MDFNTIYKRTKNLITGPAGEWESIVSEKKTGQEVLKNFVLPYIIAIAIASAAGSFIFSYGWFSLPFFAGRLLIGVIAPLAGIYLASYFINLLAKSYNSVPSPDNSFTLVAYSFTAIYLIQIVTGLFPFLVFTAIAGLYSFYILWHGIIPMMKTPAEKRTGYFVISILVIIAIYFTVGIIFELLVTVLFFPGPLNFN